MNKIIFFTLLITSLCSAQAELIEDFKTDENNHIYYSEVIQVEGASQNDLYVRSKQFFAEAFKSANHVIQMDEKDAGIIMGKGSAKVYISNFGATSSFVVNFSIKLQSKDGRFKYELYDFSHDGVGPLEQWFYKSNYYKKNGNPKKIQEQVKTQTLSIINDLIAAIKTNMQKPAVSSDEKW